MGSTAEAITVLPIAALEVGPTNPRKAKPADRNSIHELAQAIERVGVLNPLTVRKTKAGKYEVLAGRRRLEAAKKAGLMEVPVRVVAADDDLALDIGLIENGQREPLDPLDEAAAIASRLAGGHTVKEVASWLSKTPAYIARRSNLRNLHPDLIEQLRRPDGFLRSWTAGAVEALALLASDQQQELVRSHNWTEHAPSEEEVQEAIGFEIRLLDSAPWKLTDEDLVPAAGPCTRCPMNSANSPDLFGGIIEGVTEGAPICRSGGCWSKKLVSWRDRELEAARAKHGAELVLINGARNFGGATTEQHTVATLSELDLPPGKKALSEHEFEVAKKSDKGAVPAFVARGAGTCKVLWIQMKKTGTAKTKKAKVEEVKEGTPEHLDHLEERMHRRRKMLVVDGMRDELLPKAKCPPLDMLLGLVFAYGAPLDHTMAEPLKDRQAAFKNRDLDELWAVVRGEIHRFLTRSEAVEVEQQYTEAAWLCEILGLNDKYEQLVEKAEEEVPESRQMKKLKEEFAEAGK